MLLWGRGLRGSGAFGYPHAPRGGGTGRGRFGVCGRIWGQEHAMPIQNVNLPEGLAEFIRRRIESGRYQDAGEVIRAGLRLLEQQEAEDAAKLERLKTIASDAFDRLDRGESTTIPPGGVEGFMDGVDRRAREYLPLGSCETPR